MKKVILLVYFSLVFFYLIAQQWNTTIEHLGIECLITEGCCTENDETIFVGYLDTEAYCVKVDKNGDYIDKLFSIEGRTTKFFTIVSLDNGNYFITGTSKTTNEDYLWVLVIDDDLNIVSECFYEKEEEYADAEFYGYYGKTIVDDDGTIVAFVSVSMPFLYPETYRTRAVFMRFNTDCERLNSVFISPDAYGNIFYDTNFWLTSIMIAPDNDDILVIGPGSGNSQSILRFDSDFNLIHYKVIHEPTLTWAPIEADSDYWSDHNNILLVANMYDPDIHNKSMLVFGRANIDSGDINNNIWINKTDTLNYTTGSHSMCTVNDTTIYLVSLARVGNWLAPANMEIYLVNKNLEILGYKYFYNETYYVPRTAITTKDGAIIAVSTNINKRTRIKKLLREDFNPIPCSVSEVPKELLKVTAFPNPTRGELNIDISDLPQNTENRISITDMHGITRMNRIIQGSGNLLTIDVSAFEAGVYLYSIYNSEKVFVKGKFMKE